MQPWLSVALDTATAHSEFISFGSAAPEKRSRNKKIEAGRKIAAAMGKH
jgi:hypothetical protein